MFIHPKKESGVLARRYLLVRSMTLLRRAATVLAVGRLADGAANFPNGFKASTVACGLDRPTVMALAPGARIFVAEQGGRVRVIKNGQLLDKMLLSIPVRADSQEERGVIGLGLDPDFAQGRPLVYYTLKARNGTPPHYVIARFRVKSDRVVPETEKSWHAFRT